MVDGKEEDHVYIPRRVEVAQILCTIYRKYVAHSETKGDLGS